MRFPGSNPINGAREGRWDPEWEQIHRDGNRSMGMGWGRSIGMGWEQDLLGYPKELVGIPYPRL